MLNGETTETTETNSNSSAVSTATDEIPEGKLVGSASDDDVIGQYPERNI